MLQAPNLSRYDWLEHGFGLRDSDTPGGVSTLRQIHSAIVREAVPPARDRWDEGDALLTLGPRMRVGVRTADCVPILIADERTHAVAAVHAGWRGTGQRIVGAAVSGLVSRFGSRAEDLHAAVGPSIGRCCYEVGPEVLRSLGLPDSGHPENIDLAAVNRAQLEEAGVQDVWVARECTFCEPERYFSFRREKEQAGRMLSWIGTR